MLLKTAAALCLLAGVLAEKARYDNYRVFRLTPATQSQVEALRALEENPDGLSFWTDVRAANLSVDVMVPPHKISEFSEIMDELRMESSLFISDVQKLVDAEKPDGYARATGFGWDNYYRLANIHDWLRSLVAAYPEQVSLVNVGKSYEGRDLLGVKVSYQSNNPAVVVEAGIHAREWISPATVTYILNQLLTSTNTTVRSVAQNYDWYFFPTTNPDGYEYTHTTNRMWRKTRSRGRLLCHGVDPNRNWGFHWMDGGASANPCSETYAGPSAFSEPETRLLADYVKTIPRAKVYLSVHSYSQVLLVPYGILNLKPDNFDSLMDIGRKAVASLASKHGTKYEVGNTVDLMYVSSGASEDWARGTAEIPIAYCYELRDLGAFGFLLPATQIVPSGEETLDSFITLVTEARKTF
ncbi:zinc carboxypeptidase-like [Bacillus rossius redtenbacheri]|uniref:zinc carboxypeptidase-like n=1 Tax=Bacillus rossius redtenbacheri TaxID=93214 RepID=UPI002FDE0885